MGKTQKKTGKGRIDKYYKLAKCVSTPFYYPTLDSDRLLLGPPILPESKAIELVPLSNLSNSTKSSSSSRPRDALSIFAPPQEVGSK